MHRRWYTLIQPFNMARIIINGSHTPDHANCFADNIPMFDHERVKKGKERMIYIDKQACRPYDYIGLDKTRILLMPNERNNRRGDIPICWKLRCVMMTKTFY